MNKFEEFANGLNNLDSLVEIKPADFNSVEELAKVSGFEDIEEFEESVVKLDELMENGIWVCIDDGNEQVSVNDFTNVMGPYATVRVLDFSGWDDERYIYSYVEDVEAFRFNDKWYAKFDAIIG